MAVEIGRLSKIWLTKMDTYIRDGRTWVKVGQEPYTRKDGSLTELVVWNTKCAKCDTLIEVKTPISAVEFSKYPVFSRKHCAEHKLTSAESSRLGRAAQKAARKSKSDAIRAAQKAARKNRAKAGKEKQRLQWKRQRDAMFGKLLAHISAQNAIGLAPTTSAMRRKFGEIRYAIEMLDILWAIEARPTPEGWTGWWVRLRGDKGVERFLT